MRNDMQEDLRLWKVCISVSVDWRESCFIGASSESCTGVGDIAGSVDVAGHFVQFWSLKQGVKWDDI